MKCHTLGLVVALAAALAAPAVASEDEKEAFEHYRAEKAETLEQAVKNFSEYNAQVAKVLEKAELSPDDVEEIHEATYTLEEALDRIEEGMEELEEQLETLHRASEAHQEAEVRETAKAYLTTAGQIIP
jgi:mannitol-1-phosphate/altronate dehydrogenase